MTPLFVLCFLPYLKGKGIINKSKKNLEKVFIHRSSECRIHTLVPQISSMLATNRHVRIASRPHRPYLLQEVERSAEVPEEEEAHDRIEIVRLVSEAAGVETETEIEEDSCMLTKTISPTKVPSHSQTSWLQGGAEVFFLFFKTHSLPAI